MTALLMLPMTLGRPGNRHSIGVICRLLLLGLLLGIASPAQVGPALVGEDVCEVVRDLASRNGMELVVSGEFVAGRHVVALKGQKCSRTAKNSSICVQWTSQQSSPKVEFRTNAVPSEAVASAARVLRDSDSGFTSSATIAGKLFVAPPGRGFCHANQYEVMLVAKDLVEYRTATRGISGGEGNLQVTGVSTVHYGEGGQ